MEALDVAYEGSDRTLLKNLLDDDAIKAQVGLEPGGKSPLCDVRAYFS